MDYSKPHLLDELAAEYALGTLRGRARARYERLLAQQPLARAYLNSWELRLARLLTVDAATPPAQARAELMQAIVPSRLATVRPPRRRIAWALAASLGAVCMLLAFVAGQYSRSTERHLVSAVSDRDAEGRPYRYVAELHVPSSNMGWLLGLSPDGRQLSAVAGDDFLTLGRRNAQLWLKSPDGSMTPLGPLPLERDVAAVYDLPERVRGQAQVVFAISLEPATNAQSSAPSGPLLVTTPSADGI